MNVYSLLKVISPKIAPALHLSVHVRKSAPTITLALHLHIHGSKLISPISLPYVVAPDDLITHQLVQQRTSLLYLLSVSCAAVSLANASCVCLTICGPYSCTFLKFPSWKSCAPLE